MLISKASIKVNTLAVVAVGMNLHGARNDRLAKHGNISSATLNQNRESAYKVFEIFDSAIFFSPVEIENNPALYFVYLPLTLLYFFSVCNTHTDLLFLFLSPQLRCCCVSVACSLPFLSPFYGYLCKHEHWQMPTPGNTRATDCCW